VVFFAWRGIAAGMQPLHCLSREVGQRSPHDLMPIATAGQPAEIVPLLDAINALMQQLGSALETERRFTDYAAHELRTPLAAIKTLHQTASNSTNAAERAVLHAKLEQAINRATHLVTQLLTLARVSHADLAMKSLDVRALVHECVSELSSMLHAKRQQIHWHTQARHDAYSHAPLLHTLVHNIIHNAIHYTPDGGDITITMHDEETALIVTITDSGPGIAPEERARVFESFYRGESPSPSGAGLGLSIVRHIAQKLGIEVALGAPPSRSGLEVTIRLPKSAT